MISFLRAALYALLTSAMFLGDAAGQASDGLEIRSFWTIPTDHRVDSLLATPDGGLVAVISRTDQDPLLYRFDRRAVALWSVALPGVGGSIRIVHDDRGGFLICSLSRGLSHVDENGQVDWQLNAGGRALEAVWSMRSCDQALPAADGVLVMGRAANGPLYGPSAIRVAKIDRAGALEWLVETQYRISDDAPATMVLLPNGDIWIFLGRSRSEGSGWLGRLSSDGRWQPRALMENGIPPHHEWQPTLETVSLTQQKTLRLLYAIKSEAGNASGCGFLADEWNTEGTIRLAEFILADTPSVAPEDYEVVTYLGRWHGRDAYLIDCGFDPRFRLIEIMMIDPDHVSRRYAVGAIEATEATAFSLGAGRLFFSEYAGGGFEILYAKLPDD